MAGHTEDRRGIPLWGGLAVPACALWGTLIGVVIGYVSGNMMIGGAIGAGLGVGVGIVIFAAALVQASRHL